MGNGEEHIVTTAFKGVLKQDAQTPVELGDNLRINHTEESLNKHGDQKEEVGT